MKHSLTTLALLLLASNAVAQQGYSAKSLFFGEDNTVIVVPTGVKKPVLPIPNNITSVPKRIGVSYFVRLKKMDGTTRDVLASRKFKSGEHFQLGVKVNHATYVYILNEDPDHRITQIYPADGQNNFVNAMGTVVFPRQGSFEFDNNRGTEQLLVYLSPTPIRGNLSEKIRKTRPDIESVVADTRSGADACARPLAMRTNMPVESDKIEIASAGPEYISKGIEFKDDSVQDCASESVVNVSENYTSKGIVFSEDKSSPEGGHAAAYVVKTVAKTDTSLYLKLKLVHE